MKLLLIECLFSVSVVVVASQDHTLFVEPSEGSLCPSSDKKTLCKSLEWYANHVDESFFSNTVMVFLEGTHDLKTSIIVKNCQNFTMIGNGSISYNNEDLPQPAWMD